MLAPSTRRWFPNALGLDQNLIPATTLQQARRKRVNFVVGGPICAQM